MKRLALIILMLILTNSVLAYTLPSQKLYYSFNNDTGGVAQDSSGNNYWGLYYNSGVTNNGCILGNCSVHNGTLASSSYIRVMNNSASVKGSSQASLSLWIKPFTQSYVSYPYIYQDATPTNLFKFALNLRDNPNGLSVLMGFSPNEDAICMITTNYYLPYDVWTHVAVSFNGSYTRIWVNGTTIKNSTLCSGMFMSTTSPAINVGAWTSGGYSLNGTLDELHVWNVSINQSDVDFLFNEGVPTTTTTSTTTTTISTTTTTINPTLPLISNCTLTPDTITYGDMVNVTYTIYMEETVYPLDKWSLYPTINEPCNGEECNNATGLNGTLIEFMVEFNANDTPIGDYDFVCWVNDTSGNENSYIFDTMHVVEPGSPITLEYSVSNFNSLAPIEGANVILTGLNTFSDLTDIDGIAALYLSSGTYDVNVRKSGYFPYDSYAHVFNDSGFEVVYLTPSTHEGIIRLTLNDLTYSEHDVCLYFDNGRLQGCYQVNDTITLHNNMNYTIVPKVYKMDLIGNPNSYWLYLPTLLGAVVVLFVLALLVALTLITYDRIRGKRR